MYTEFVSGGHFPCIGTLSNSDFSVWDSEYRFQQISSKNRSCLFKLKFATYTDLKLLKIRVTFKCSLLYQKYIF